jgi:hypothetical protein
MSDETSDAASRRETRRPYAPPAVSWEEAFDAQANLASACAKIGGQSDECNTQPTS